MYPNCTTILNSERAALKRCYEIYRECKDKDIKRWIDLEFGPDPKLKGEGKDLEKRTAQIKDCIYMQGENVPNGLPSPGDMNFKDPRDLQEGIEPKFLISDASANDVR